MTTLVVLGILAVGGLVALGLLLAFLKLVFVLVLLPFRLALKLVFLPFRLLFGLLLIPVFLLFGVFGAVLALPLAPLLVEVSRSLDDPSGKTHPSSPSRCGPLI